MAVEFQYDVFLSHNSKDKPRVRRLAERLKQAGLRVWFDEWTSEPGDIIALKVDEGLEQSRVLLLCISPNALASGWVALERSTAIHRDPANAGRRFIPLLLADCELPDTLRRYKYVDFREEAEAAFAEVLAACQPEMAESQPSAAEEEARPPCRKISGKKPAPKKKPARKKQPEATGADRAAGRAGTQAHGAQGLGQERGRQPGWEMGGVRLSDDRRSRFGIWRPANAGRRWKGIRIR